jgi:uncharacterized damage-inducible protein DinB
MRQFTHVLFFFVALSGTLVTLGAQSPAKVSGFRGIFLSDWKDSEDKLIALAGAIPQDKYTWRPGKGVRSVSEVYMHVAGTNYFMGGPIGVKPPSAFNFNSEKTVTEKAKVIEALRSSFTQIRQAVMNLSDADLSKPTTTEGQQTTLEGMLFFLAGHTHEHLGQLIAYARSNGIVPPWSKD